MHRLYAASFVLASFCSAVHVAQPLQYSDLESLGISCPMEHKCALHPNNFKIWQRGCECDSACDDYQDCCLDARRQASGQAASFSTICLDYGSYDGTGIYAVSRCSENWNGFTEVKQKCESSADLSDPVSAAPTISYGYDIQAVTYKNHHCAVCNNADLMTLRPFIYELSCKGLFGPSQEEIRDQLSYNPEKQKWGVHWVDARGNSDFKECDIRIELPSYLRESVRFCLANTISKCAPDWKKPQVAKLCGEYAAVVYGVNDTYRNPHCAICNYKSASELYCWPPVLEPPNFSLLFNINREIKKKKSRRCPSNQIFDRILNTCKPVKCVVPGYVIRKGRCVPGD